MSHLVEWWWSGGGSRKTGDSSGNADVDVGADPGGSVSVACNSSPVLSGITTSCGWWVHVIGLLVIITKQWCYKATSHKAKARYSKAKAKALDGKTEAKAVVFKAKALHPCIKITIWQFVFMHSLTETGAEKWKVLLPRMEKARVESGTEPPEPIPDGETPPHACIAWAQQ